ncbi:MAG: hypothetical protein COT91_00120 [Candidatus Doudnabacteria bacterium CG10_big_fil_rev_8_21_14_0_10_41_10]|uniref:DUF2178 domain-containing protein n=1 Tax=Candidatus Doudnabacteria bacterium CG10_big_fil_rev_8_21_14_0_10_41_10 TaxID=1974551 RepID=A0A2H0VF02_9BACT|nr:MAG: hypothetical protein COT91_00120 [Candidatus Doudnabacteria bacterium CG10_big_fil_rev_8_21_14_0_10_41_10]
MKVILYYLLSLVFIVLFSVFLVTGKAEAMAMPQMVGVCVVLVLYTIIISLVGEGRSLDEREVSHRNLSNRVGLIAGTVVLSVGIIYQLFINHHLDYWMLLGLAVINFAKLITLIFLHHKK